MRPLEVGVVGRAEELVEGVDVEFVFDRERGLFVERGGERVLVDFFARYPVLLFDEVSRVSLEEYVRWRMSEAGEVVGVDVSFGGIPVYRLCVVVCGWLPVMVGDVVGLEEDGSYSVRLAGGEVLRGRGDGLVIAEVRYGDGGRDRKFWLVDTRRWLVACGVFSSDGKPMGQALWFDPVSEDRLTVQLGKVRADLGGSALALVRPEWIDVVDEPLWAAEEVVWLPGGSSPPAPAPPVGEPGGGSR